MGDWCAPCEQDEAWLEEQPRQRAVCGRCSRPAAHDCLCAALPSQPLDTRGLVVVLQHPAEQKRALATVPLLSASLRNVHVVRRRTYQRGRSDLLDAVVAAASRQAQPLPVFLLWPSADAADVADAAATLQPALPSTTDDSSETTAPLARCAYVLLVLDGTWAQCAEMARPLRSSPLGRLCHVVRLSAAHVPNDPACMLRTEPAAGCVVTVEAVARALAPLEAVATGNAARADTLREALLAPLRLLVSLQRRRDALGKGVKGGAAKAGQATAAATPDAHGGAEAV